MAAAEVLAPYASCLSRPLPGVAADLESYAALLLKWNRAQNLVSRETLGNLWERHIADSLQILPLLRDADRTLLDLGSGGGFPAIPIAIAKKGALNVLFVEPIAKKAAFLRTVSRETRVPLQVEMRRAEAIVPGELPPVDVITSRALAPLSLLLGLAAPFFGPTTRALLHKGREHVDEMAESGAVWHYDVVVHRSVIGAGGVVLEIGNLRRR